MKRSRKRAKGKPATKPRGAQSSERAPERSAPRASRPNIPGYGIVGANAGRGLLPWAWAEKRLGKSWNYWLATARADGRPHVMPVWGLWHAGAFWFSTGEKTVKARNLAANPNCVVCTERAAEAVVLEGSADWVPPSAALEPLWAAYRKKYDWQMKGTGFYRVRPRVAFGLIEKDELFTQTATRWIFP